MPRQRVIVGIGEALLCEFPDRIEPGGLAVLCAKHAVRLGHAGIVVSRVGQDAAADELLKLLRDQNVKVDHIQSDPDLATGRLVVRSIAGRTTRSLTARAAFDNLQWDFDLVDVAQQADAVIFGNLARRVAQSQSIIKRFLAECTGAVRVFDLTNRESDAIDRSEARSGLEFAQVLVADAPAFKSLAASAVSSGQDMHAAALELMRSGELLFVVGIERGDCTETWSVHTKEQAVRARQSHASAQHEAALIGLLHGVLSGWDFARCLDLASQVAEHAAKKPNESFQLS
jgi:sugar/nucleoside kinase (ribokinase family)